jgi:adenylate cyclase
MNLKKILSFLLDKNKKFLQLSLILFIIYIFVSILYYLNILYFLEKNFSDLRFKIRGPLKPSGKVIIVAIDENSLETLGRWPWDRKVLAKGIESLYKVGAKIVALDILFLEKSNFDSDTALSNALKKGESVIAYHFEEKQVNTIKKVKDKQIFVQEIVEEAVLPIDIVKKNAKMGFVNIYPDSDGVPRKIVLVKNYNNETYFSFDKTIAETYKKGISKDIPPNFLINYYGPSGTYTRYSFLLTMYDSFREFIKDKMKDKIILIGSMATATYDHYPTPFQETYPGVELHANVIENILNKTYLRQFNKNLYLILLAIVGILTMFLFYKISPINVVFITILGIVLYYFLTVFIFIKLKFVVDTIPFFAITISAAGINIINKVVEEQKEKRLIKGVFSKYVSPTVLDEILTCAESLSLGGKKHEITVMFTDIRKFTSLSEQLPAEEVVSLLNQYFEVMNEIIFKYNGTLDKYIGDAIMCFWNAPVEQKDHPERAVRCAIEMLAELEKLNKILVSQGKPRLAMGIGINTGYAIVGNVGSHQRMEYTVVGDTVNIASRLQDLTKDYATPIIISETVNNFVKDTIETESLGKIVIRGKTQDLELFKIKGYS